MRMILGVLSLLIAVVVIGLLAKKQVAPLSGASPAPAVGVALPVATPQAASPQLQSQMKKSLDDALQSVRPEGDDK